jgi:hypothetical protein
MLKSDHFQNFSAATGGIEGHGRDPQELKIIDEIIAEMCKAKSKTMKTVSKMIESLHDEKSFYGLLVGEIQSGKTPAQMFLIWVWCRKFRGNVCFITKSLDSIRRDIMSKFNSTLIKKHIITVCLKYGYSEEDALKLFGLTYHIYTDRKVKKLGKAGQVEIILMQKDNFSHVRRWYNDICEVPRPAPALFVIDEMHEMYGGAESFLENKGLTSVKKISNIGMLHWLQQKMIFQKCFVIGVTATPYAPMTGDPICWPTKVFNLQTDAPADGLTYYGYGPDDTDPLKQTKLMNILVKTYTNELNSVAEILARPRHLLKNGLTEVPMICIASKFQNEEQNSIMQLLKDTFHGKLNILVFNQDNKVSLEDWFSETMLTKEICETGALVIIGRACLAAGITIKPAKSIDVSFDKVTYTVSGITDQIMPNNDINVTTTKQLMRLLGWFPDGHASTLWLQNEKLHHVYKQEFVDIHQQFMQNYSATLGPESLKNITLESTRVKSFYTNDFYRVSANLAPRVKTSSFIPVDKDNIPFNILETQVLKLTRKQLTSLKKENFLELTIEDFHGQPGKQGRLREILNYSSGNVDHMQIGYDNGRTEQIMKAAFSPHDVSVDNWQVNGFLWGRAGPASKIKDCYTIKFLEDFQTRDQKDGDYKSKTCFQRSPGEWVYIETIKTKEHSKLKLFSELAKPMNGRLNSFSEKHHLILAALDEIAQEEKAGRPLTSWSLFMKCHKIEFKTGAGAICSPVYKKYKDKFIKLVSEDWTDQQKIIEGCAAIAIIDQVVIAPVVEPVFAEAKKSKIKLSLKIKTSAC